MRKTISKILAVALSVCVLVSALYTGIVVFAASDSYSGGSGTSADPYIISSAEDMALLDKDTVDGKTAGKYYKLASDITLENLSIGQNSTSVLYLANTTGGTILGADSEYLPDAKPFEGVFDGSFYTITYTYKTKYALGGLFSGLRNATVKNVIIKGNAVEPRINFGSIAGFASNSRIENCISEVNVSRAGMWSAGIAGVTYNTVISNTENRGDITQSGRWPNKQMYLELQKYVDATYEIDNKDLYDWSHVAIGGIVSMGCGDLELTDVLNSGDVTNDYNSDFTETGGVVAILKNASGTSHAVKFNSVGNTGAVKSLHQKVSYDRIGGVYGILENTIYTFNKIWSTGLVTPAKDSSGTIYEDTGAVGGGMSSACQRVGDVIAYGIQGKIVGKTQSYTKVRDEFFAKQWNFGGSENVTIYYDGDVYEPADTSAKVEKLDLKSSAFAEQLGTNWQAVENGYPILKTAARLRNVTVSKSGTENKADLTPDFDPNVYEYTVKVPNATDKIVIKADAANGGTVSGDIGEKSIAVGKNTFTVTVTAADGAKMDYTITVRRLSMNVGTDASLKSLKVSGTKLNEAFSKDETDYTVNAAWRLKKVTISAEASNSSSEVFGTGEKELEIGLNTFEIKVIAEDDSEKVYTLKITRAPLFKAGSGTKDEPYLISDEDDLRNLSYASNETFGTMYNGVYFKQTADIDLRNEQWTPICAFNIFAGHYDGNGYTIKNLKIDVDNDSVNSLDSATGVSGLGLFGCTGAGADYTASFKNINVEVSIVNNTSSLGVGGIAGAIKSTYKATNDTVPLFENCTVKGSIASRKGNAGGILGYADNGSVKIIDCTNYASVKIPSDGYTPEKTETFRYVGGITSGIWVHDQLTVISGCVNYGDITGYKYVGGITGRISQSASSDRNNGITAEEGYEAVIEKCANYGNIALGTFDINEKGDIGGLIGSITDGGHKVIHMAKVKLSNLYNVGTITAMNYYDSDIGGIVGRHNLLGDIENCYNAGKFVVSEERALSAGVIGILADRGDGEMSTMTNCYYWDQDDIEVEGVPVGFDSDIEGVVEKVTWMQVSNGELAYMLDKGDSADRTYIWTQDTEKCFPVIGDGAESAVYKTANGYTVGENGKLIVGKASPDVNDDEEDDNNGNDNSNGNGGNDNNGTVSGYPVVIDTDILNAELDLVNHRLILPDGNVAIWELNGAMTLDNVTVAYYNADGSEITNDELIMTEGMVMKVFNEDGSLLDTFKVIYRSSLPTTGEDVNGVNIAVATIAIAFVIVCVLYRKKKYMYN